MGRYDEELAKAIETGDYTGFNVSGDANIDNKPRAPRGPGRQLPNDGSGNN